MDKSIIHKERDSSIEMLRIITMIIIIAHHYVVNSGLIDIILQDPMSLKSLALLMFGWGGKYGINIFVMITGYFMCTSNISLKKFLKLFMEIEFYNIVIYTIFMVTGYMDFSLKEFIKTVFPVWDIGVGFYTSYLVFYLFIPSLNKLIKGMTDKQHIKLIYLCVIIFTIFPSILINVPIGYVGWFMIIYFIGSYIRLYPKKILENTRFWGILSICLLIISWISIVFCIWLNSRGLKIGVYHFVADCNKVLALVPAITTFLFFKNLHLGYNKIINNIASTTFGVLLIHANSDIMRSWLWKDMLSNTGMYETKYTLLHACLTVLIVYMVCSLMDYLRIISLERPMIQFLDKVIDHKNKKI